MMPQRYAAEIKILAGHFVNHDDNMEDNELAKDLELTETLWEEAYGVPYLDKQQQHQVAVQGRTLAFAHLPERTSGKKC
jgi:hypothetical protein